MKENTKKSTKLKTIKYTDWYTAPETELSTRDAIERFYKIKAEEKRRMLLEEVKNVGILLS